MLGVLKHISITFYNLTNSKPVWTRGEIRFVADPAFFQFPPCDTCERLLELSPKNARHKTWHPNSLAGHFSHPPFFKPISKPWNKSIFGKMWPASVLPRKDVWSSTGSNSYGVLNVEILQKCELIPTKKVGFGDDKCWIPSISIKVTTARWKISNNSGWTSRRSCFPQPH